MSIWTHNLDKPLPFIALSSKHYYVAAKWNKEDQPFIQNLNENFVVTDKMKWKQTIIIMRKDYDDDEKKIVAIRSSSFPTYISN